MTDTTQYICLKLGQAAKAGERATGQISYSVLSDTDRQELYLTLTGNEGGGWFSREIIPLSRIEAVLDALTDRFQPLHSKVLRPAFDSKSVNNAGFLAALLRAEGLLTPAPDSPHQHLLTDDWDIWKSVMLSEPGTPYDPITKGSADSTNKEDIVAETDTKPVAQGKRRGRRKAAQNDQSDAVVTPVAPSTDLSEDSPVLEEDVE